ncbi:MAG: DUF1501 domain-containing protein [Planctomycetaceae bacterium]
MLSVLFRTNAAAGRRELIRVGALGGLSLAGRGLPAVTGQRGQQRSAVFIFLFGGPSQLDMWDMKPAAPVEIRGQFQPISTSAPGVQICEHLPQLAGQMHRVCLVRSMNHRMPVHGPACSELYSGRPYPLPPVTDQARREDWPSLAALLTRSSLSASGLPPAIVLPWHSQFMGQSERIAGQSGGRMGEQFNPFLLRAGLDGGQFDAAELQLPDASAGQRLQRRTALLQRLQETRIAGRGVLESGGQGVGSAAAHVRWQQQHDSAVSLLSGGQLGVAVDLERERPEVLARYGGSVFGRSLLAARRLVEAGVPLITVNWYDDSFHDKVSPHWDQHNHIFASLKDRMLPIFDRAMAAFVGDLGERGLLSTTMVAAAGEFGRTPRIGQFTQNAMTEKSGRDHWPHAFTALLAGGGIRGGQVFGSTDHQAGQVRDNPVSPADLTATLLGHLGVSTDESWWDPIQGQWQKNSEGQRIAFEYD